MSQRRRERSIKMPLAGKGAYGLGRVDLPEGFKHDGVA